MQVNHPESKLKAEVATLRNFGHHREAGALDRLLNAVEALYYRAIWSGRDPSGHDVPGEEANALWTEVRDAAGFAPGYSPKLERTDRFDR